MNHYEKNPNPRVEQYDVVKVAVSLAALVPNERIESLVHALAASVPKDRVEFLVSALHRYVEPAEYARTHLWVSDVLDAAKPMGLTLTEKEATAFLLENEDMLREEMTFAGQSFIETLLRDIYFAQDDDD